MEYLQLHPCYLEKLLRSEMLDFDQKKLLVQQLYTSPSESETTRLNYLLISVFENIAMHDLAQLQELPGENPFYFGQDCQMISIAIFQLVFDSDPANMDSITCIACHIINNMLTAFAQAPAGQQDTSLDVLGKAGGGGSKDAKGKGKGGDKAELPKRAEALRAFVADILEAIVKNQILKETG